MIISTLLRPSSPNTPFVFFMFEGDDIARYSLFGYLNDEEKDYVNKIRNALLELKTKETRTILMPGTARRVLIVVVSKKKEFSHQKAGMAVRIAVNLAKKEKIAKFAFWAAPMGSAKETRNFYETVAINAVMANFEFVKYKTISENGFNFIEDIEALWAKPDKNIIDGFQNGLIIGEEVNNCRDLANTPGGDMTPRILAEHAVRDAEGLKIQVDVLDKERIEELKMGGVLGVSKGSDEPPKFIIMEYWGGKKSQKPVVLVGKGVTFDTGGLNLKPTEGIYEMHMDMSGGSAVIHTIRAAARLKLKQNIIVLVPAVENMPSGSSYHPGDLLRTMSGKTIEVLNTDAEGRIILADALTYAQRYNPSLVIDVATLTGAAVVALGLRYSALFSNNRRIEEKLRKLGEETNDKVWPLPLTEEYEDDIRGTFGDWANTGKSRYGGAINGAIFLWQFTKGSNGKSYPWAHLDIAPRMTTIEGDYLAKGAAGASIRLLVKLLQSYHSL